jgi:hypothetical protein
MGCTEKRGSVAKYRAFQRSRVTAHCVSLSKHSAGRLQKKLTRYARLEALWRKRRTSMAKGTSFSVSAEQWWEMSQNIATNIPLETTSDGRSKVLWSSPAMRTFGASSATPPPTSR